MIENIFGQTMRFVKQWAGLTLTSLIFFAAFFIHAQASEMPLQNTEAAKKLDVDQNKRGSEASIACQAGAFTDALVMMTASVRAAKNMPQSSTVALAELDVILRIAIRQAALAYPCARGTLVLGYDKNYADTVRVAHAYGVTRQIHRDTLLTAEKLIADIVATGRPPGEPKATAPASTARP